MYIPAIFSGPGIPSNSIIQGVYDVTDLAPTILNAFGLNLGEFMEGRVIDMSKVVKKTN
jgi:hypothetical protein